MDRLSDLTIVCLKMPEKLPKRVPRVKVEDESIPLHQRFDAVLQKRRWADRVDGLLDLELDGKLVFLGYYPNRSIAQHWREMQRTARESGLQLRHAHMPVDGDATLLIRGFALAMVPIDELGLEVRDTPYFRACSLTEFVRSEDFSNGAKVSVVGVGACNYDTDMLLDTIGAALANRTAEGLCSDADKREIECCKALLDYKQGLLAGNAR